MHGVLLGITGMPWDALVAWAVTAQHHYVLACQRHCYCRKKVLGSWQKLWSAEKQHSPGRLQVHDPAHQQHAAGAAASQGGAGGVLQDEPPAAEAVQPLPHLARSAQHPGRWVAAASCSSLQTASCRTDTLHAMLLDVCVTVCCTLIDR
jgi:hypothetical protein